MSVLRIVGRRAGVFFAILVSLLAAGRAAADGGGRVEFDPPPGMPEHGMEVLSVVGDASKLKVTTTGGIYELTPRGMNLIRRIDPRLNKVKPRPVAKVAFDPPLGPLSVASATKRSCVINGRGVSFEFRSDCLVLLSCLSKPVSYRFESLIKDAPWAKGSGSDRMWTDGYGGSLHAANPGLGPPRVMESSPDGMTMALKPGSGTALAVFPPKPFDYDRLYGQRARPHICYAGGRDDQLARTALSLDELAAERFGVILIFGGHYEATLAKSGRMVSHPVLDGERYVYRYRRPEMIKAFVAAAHAKGFKVITYLAGGRFARKQDKDTTLAFMRELQQEFDLDGWYFDHAGAGKHWLDSYEFVRQVRADVGPEGILYHHDSVDIWGGREGCVLVPLDAYMDYTLKGETGGLAGDVHGPNSPYMRFYVSGYGLSQALGTYKIATTGRASITFDESHRVLAENLLGASRVTAWLRDGWAKSYRPGYEVRRRAYLEGRLEPDVSWPPSWFGDVRDLRVVRVKPTSVDIVWKTPVPADSEVRYALGDGGGLSGAADTSRRKLEARRQASHQVRLRGLQPGTEYQFAVRSISRGPDGRVQAWGGAGTFSTTARR